MGIFLSQASRSLEVAVLMMFQRPRLFFPASPSLAFILMLVTSWLQDGCCICREEGGERLRNKGAQQVSPPTFLRKIKAFLESPLWNLGYFVLLAAVWNGVYLICLPKFSFNCVNSVTFLLFLFMFIKLVC